MPADRSSNAPAPQVLRRAITKAREKRRGTVSLPLPTALELVKLCALLPPQVSAEDEDLLTPKEAAEQLRLSYRTLANWRSKGLTRLPFIRCGSRIRYRSSDIREYKERRQAAHTGAVTG